jgi:hypothetical protein
LYNPLNNVKVLMVVGLEADMQQGLFYGVVVNTILHGSSSHLHMFLQVAIDR